MARGAPDYTKFIWPSRDQLIDGQKRAHGTIGGGVGAGTGATVDLLTTGAKEFAYIGNVTITCDDNFMQLVKLKANALEFAQRVMIGSTTFTGESHAGMTVDTSDTLQAILINDDIIDHNYYIQYVATIQEL